MSATSHSPAASHPGGDPPKGQRNAARVPVGGRVAGAIALLVVGLPLALVLTTSVTLWVLAWSPTYQTALKLAWSVTVLAVTGVALWMGAAIEKQNRGAGSLVAAASVFTAVTALIVVLAAAGGSGPGAPPPTVINASSQTVVILSGPEGNLHRWKTLAPGEQVVADAPFLSLNGCYEDMWLEARTTGGRVIATMSRPCARDIWRITNTGAERNYDDR